MLAACILVNGSASRSGMSPRRGRDERAGTVRSELLEDMGLITDPEPKITGCGEWVKAKVFWFFEPVEDSGRQMAVRKRWDVSAQTRSLKSLRSMPSLLRPATSTISCNATQLPIFGAEYLCGVTDIGVAMISIQTHSIFFLRNTVQCTRERAAKEKT